MATRRLSWSHNPQCRRAHSEVGGYVRARPWPGVMIPVLALLGTVGIGIGGISRACRGRSLGVAIEVIVATKLGVW